MHRDKLLHTVISKSTAAKVGGRVITSFQTEVSQCIIVLIFAFVSSQVGECSVLAHLIPGSLSAHLTVVNSSTNTLFHYCESFFLFWEKKPFNTASFLVGFWSTSFFLINLLIY